MMRARELSKCVKNSYHVVITSIYVGISIGECNEVKLDQTVEHHRDKTFRLAWFYSILFQLKFAYKRGSHGDDFPLYRVENKLRQLPTTSNGVSFKASPRHILNTLHKTKTQAQ